MLGMIAGFKPAFVDETRGSIVYGPASAPDAPAAALLASDAAHRFLLKRGRYPAGDAADNSFEGVPFLSLFPVGDASAGEGGAALRSDIVAAAFFFLSLHEEWSAEDRDAFDRFQWKHSLLGALGTSERPVVAEYARVLRAFLERHGMLSGNAEAGVADRPLVCFTHDIDYMTKFTPGLFYRESIRYMLWNQLGMPFNARLSRFREYLGFARAGRDPYIVSLDRILDRLRERRFHSTFFLKTGRSDLRDAPMNLRASRIRGRVARMLDEGHEVGVHPSFNTYLSPSMLEDETRLLEHALARPVRTVRQHYLRFRYPDTWRHQIAAGLRVDSTLGFAEREGFRNGVCHPFLPFDLDHGTVLPIWALPLVVMDGTLASYRRLDPDQSLQRLRALFRAVCDAGGVFVVLFHNTCYDAHDFPGWAGVFESFLDDCRDAGAECLTLTEAVERRLARAGYADRQELIDLVASGY
jgi:peptidoglycan/xylan/chitin deacetylase (PgdA/CDA1 family)